MASPATASGMIVVTHVSKRFRAKRVQWPRTLYPVKRHHKGYSASLQCNGGRCACCAHAIQSRLSYIKALIMSRCSSDPVDFTPTRILSSSFNSSSIFTLTMRSTAALFAISALFPSAFAATYNLKDSFVGESFLSGFTHQAIADPTHGRV